MNQREQAIATKTYEVYTDKYSCIVQAESIQDALETFAAYYRRDETDEVWAVEDVAMREEDRKSAAALSEPGGEAPVEAKALTDEEIERIAEELHPTKIAGGDEAFESMLRDTALEGLRYARDNGYLAPAPAPPPISADRIMEVVRDTPHFKLMYKPGTMGADVMDKEMEALRSRLSSELGIR